MLVAIAEILVGNNADTATLSVPSSEGSILVGTDETPVKTEMGDKAAVTLVGTMDKLGADPILRISEEVLANDKAVFDRTASVVDGSLRLVEGMPTLSVISEGSVIEIEASADGKSRLVEETEVSMFNDGPLIDDNVVNGSGNEDEVTEVIAKEGSGTISGIDGTSVNEAVENREGSGIENVDPSSEGNAGRLVTSGKLLGAFSAENELVDLAVTSETIERMTLINGTDVDVRLELRSDVGAKVSIVMAESENTVKLGSMVRSVGKILGMEGVGRETGSVEGKDDTEATVIEGVGRDES